MKIIGIPMKITGIPMTIIPIPMKIIGIPRKICETAAGFSGGFMPLQRLQAGFNGVHGPKREALRDPYKRIEQIKLYNVLVSECLGMDLRAKTRRLKFLTS